MRTDSSTQAAPDGGVANRSRSLYLLLFLSLAVLLMVMPFITTFNEFLTRLAQAAHLDTVIQNFIVPTEAKLIGVVLTPFGIDVVANPRGLTANGFPVTISWNCIGWQSLVLLLLTFATGLQGSYTRGSKLEVVVLGLLGTFWLNILRLSLVVMVAVWYGQLPAVIFHDYFSTAIVIGWFFILWWFSYRFVLTPKPFRR
jgi:exosortase/archaeosortase family protein